MVVLRARRSTWPDCRIGQRCCTEVGVYLTFVGIAENRGGQGLAIIYVDAGPLALVVGDRRSPAGRDGRRTRGCPRALMASSVGDGASCCASGCSRDAAEGREAEGKTFQRHGVRMHPRSSAPSGATVTFIQSRSLVNRSLTCKACRRALAPIDRIGPAIDASRVLDDRHDLHPEISLPDIRMVEDFAGPSLRSRCGPSGGCNHDRRWLEAPRTGAARRSARSCRPTGSPRQRRRSRRRVWGRCPGRARRASGGVGRVISARPIASICCSPPDSVSARCGSRSSRRGKSSEHARERLLAVGLAAKQVGARGGGCRLTDRRGNRRRFSGT